MAILLEVIFFASFVMLLCFAGLIYIIQSSDQPEFTDVIISEMPDPYPDLDLPEGIHTEEKGK